MTAIGSTLLKLHLALAYEYARTDILHHQLFLFFQRIESQKAIFRNEQTEFLHQSSFVLEFLSNHIDDLSKNSDIIDKLCQFKSIYRHLTIHCHRDNAIHFILKYKTVGFVFLFHRVN